MSDERFELQPASPVPRICVVYDAAGAVVHLHQIIALPGAPEATDTELAAEALEQAGYRSGNVKGLRTLVVDRDTVDRVTAYRVDPKKRALVPIERAGKPAR